MPFYRQRVMDIIRGIALQADEVQLLEASGRSFWNLYAPSMRWVMCIILMSNRVISKRAEGAGRTLNTKDTNVWEGDYQMVLKGRQGRGKPLYLMKQRGESRYTILETAAHLLSARLRYGRGGEVKSSMTVRERRLRGSGTPGLK